MRRFRYRLERVLQFRALREAQAKRELQIAQAALVQSEVRLAELEQALVQECGAGESVEASSAVVMRAEDWLLIDRYRAGLRVRIELQHRDIEAKRSVVEERMREYREVARELESLKRHRTVKLSEYEQELLVAEQASIDELTVQRHSRTGGKATA